MSSYEPEQARVAAVDMGSNTTRLIVADVTRDTTGNISHKIIERKSVITRLAEGVDKRGILLPEPITRVRQALTDFRQTAIKLGAVFVLATATSAVRDADNGEAFLGEVEHSFGFRAELLTGEQEAEATWNGVTSDSEMAAKTRAGSGFLIDIGGGSTEIVLSNQGKIIDRHSFQLGSVRLTERYLHSSPVSTEELAAARDHALAVIAERFPNALTPDIAIAVAGTSTTVSAILLGGYDAQRVHGYTFTLEQLQKIIANVSAMSIEERRSVQGLEPKRAEVIVGGFIALEAALKHFKIQTITTSERDILDGIALMAGRIALDEKIEEIPQTFGNTMC